MSQSLASPSPSQSLRRTWSRLWNDPDSRSVIIGLLGMLLVHLLLLLLAPWMLRSDGPSVLRPHSSAKEFNIELAEDNFLRPPEKAPLPQKFVETNPNAPENIPDKTNNFGAQNQQVAQEKPTPDGKSDRPAIEGQKEIKSTQIVSGQLQKPAEMVQSAPSEQTPPTEQQVTAPKLEQNPLSGFEKFKGDDANSFGSNVAKFNEGAKDVPEKVEGAKDVPLVEGATSTQPRIDPLRPRPRPMVVKQQQVRPAIFEENKFGTQNIGNIAYDAKWSNYGAYLQRLIETVQVQWERILIESRVYPTSGTHVKVVFHLDSQGAISQINSVEGTAGNQAEKACTSAITARAPYGAWTDDMIAVLGDSQELAFTFYYQ